ncbi:DUF3024 domain-containing protein [Lysobacter sp. CA199]|uniref:DUF3024 domain-containing protein n=1 Tax=Lysobacter sp. CA199 TaxID=3455608 RepID=UPI003F8D1CC6
MLNDIERRRAENAITKLLKPRDSPHVKSGGEVLYRIGGQIIEVYSARPAYDDPDEIIEIPIAKFRYVRTREVWQLFWLRASGKWQGYGALPEAESLPELVDEVWRDPFCCFWG